MSDPSEIKAAMSLLYKLWSMYPDQRLGQLLTNVVPDFGYFTDTPKLLSHLQAYHATRDESLVKVVAE
jgi:hypothetical protein